MKRTIAITLLLAALTLPVYAEDAQLWGSAMVRAYHSDRQTKYNENTLGAGFEYKANDWDKWKLVVGGYNNSYYRWSNYVGGAYTPLRIGNFRFGGMFGMINGYKVYNYNYGPIATGLVSYEKNGYGANLLIVPKVTSDGGFTFALQLKKQLK